MCHSNGVLPAFTCSPMRPLIVSQQRNQPPNSMPCATVHPCASARSPCHPPLRPAPLPPDAANGGLVTPRDDVLLPLPADSGRGHSSSCPGETPLPLQLLRQSAACQTPSRAARSPTAAPTVSGSFRCPCAAGWCNGRVEGDRRGPPLLPLGRAARDDRVLYCFEFC